MDTPDRLRKVLPTLPRITIHGLWSRAIGFHLLNAPPPGAPAGTSPQPLWPGGPASNGARFTPKGGFNSLYLADDPVTALHEVVSVFSHPHGPSITIRTSPWVVVAVDGVLSNIVDLTDAAVQRQLGTTTAELTGEWAYTQSVSGIAPTQILGQRTNIETGTANGGTSGWRRGFNSLPGHQNHLPSIIYSSSLIRHIALIFL